jgi:D-proline reductase (dithiol) PrdB
VGLIQSTIEAAGIPTVSISLLREVTEKVKPPRVLLVDRPLGFPLGYPHEPEVQREILRQALALLPQTNLPVWWDAVIPATRAGY